ncbi:MAG: VWA domain-containing protein [Acidobacteriota bacterium]
MSVLILVAALALAFPVLGQQREEAGASIVEVPVFVQDEKGRPVPDLKQEDFKVYEDGNEQAVTLFLPVDLGRRVEENLPAQLVRRNFIFFFDATFNSALGLMKAKDASLRFVDSQMDPQDRAAVFAFSTLKGVFMIANFTSDKTLLRSAIESLGFDRRFDTSADSAGFFNQVLLQPEVEPGMFLEPGKDLHAEIDVKSRIVEWVRDMNAFTQRIDEEFYRNTVAAYLDGLRTFARGLEFFSGRKYLIYFSGGFDTKVLGARDIRETTDEAEDFASGNFEKLVLSGSAEKREIPRELSDAMELAVRSFAASDCRVYPIDATGLESDPNMTLIDQGVRDPKAMGRRQASLFSLAEETGGKLYRNINDLNRPLASIVDETRSFYLLGYNVPARAAGEAGRYHRIKVDIRRPDVKFTYRPGYHDPRPFREFTAEERRLQVAEVISNNQTMNSIRLQAQVVAFPEKDGRSPVAVIVQVPIDQFSLAQGNPPLEIFAFALGPEGNHEAYAHGFCNVRMADTEMRSRNRGIRYSDILVPASGRSYEIRIMVRNNDSGEIGTTSIRATTLKDSGRFTMATPFFVPSSSEWINIMGYDPEKPPVRVASLGTDYPVSFEGKPCPVELFPDIQDGGSRGLLVKLYNFATGDANNEPDISVRWEIADVARNVIGQPQFKLLGRSLDREENRLEYLFDIRARGIPSGPYWLKVTATDNTSGQVATGWVPLDLR